MDFNFTTLMNPFYYSDSFFKNAFLFWTPVWYAINPSERSNVYNPTSYFLSISFLAAQSVRVSACGFWVLDSNFAPVLLFIQLIIASLGQILWKIKVFKTVIVDNFYALFICSVQIAQNVPYHFKNCRQLFDIMEPMVTCASLPVDNRLQSHTYKYRHV